HRGVAGLGHGLTGQVGRADRSRRADSAGHGLLHRCVQLMAGAQVLDEQCHLRVSPLLAQGLPTSCRTLTGLLMFTGVMLRLPITFELPSRITFTGFCCTTVWS